MYFHTDTTRASPDSFPIHDFTQDNSCIIYPSLMPTYLNNFSAVICDAFQSRCEGCTQERKDQIKNLCMYLKTNRSEDWQKLMVKYDPTGERQKIWKEILAWM